MTNIIKSIIAIYPDAQVNVSGNNIDKITWLHGTTPISKEDILAKQTELQADYDAKQYQRDREKEYPTWQDQLDDIYHNGIDSWKATIKTTKDKYPKA